MKMNKKVGNIFSFITEHMHRNFSVKLICFLLALILYVFVAFSEQTEKTFVKKLQINGLSENLIISNSLPENIKIIVKDKKKVINKLSEDDFNVHIDLSSISESTGSEKTVKVEYNIPKVMASFFSSVTVIPESLEINVEAVKEKTVRLSVPTAGVLRPGYYIKERKIKPTDVRIYGPESIINSIKAVETERVDISDEFESFERHVRINSPSPKVKLQGMQSDTATVYFVLAKKQGSKTISIERVYLTDLKKEFSGKVTNTPVSLTLVGSEAAIAELKESDIVMGVDCSNVVVPGNYSYKKVDIVLPGGISVSSMSPQMINITVTERAEEIPQSEEEKVEESKTEDEATTVTEE
jgi:YbbR domain-containing protein